MNTSEKIAALEQELHTCKELIGGAANQILELRERDEQWKRKYSQAMESWAADNVRNNEEIERLKGVSK